MNNLQMHNLQMENVISYHSALHISVLIERGYNTLSEDIMGLRKIGASGNDVTHATLCNVK